MAVLSRGVLFLLHELLGHVCQLRTVEEATGILENIIGLIVQDLLHEQLAQAVDLGVLTEVNLVANAEVTLSELV